MDTLDTVKRFLGLGNPPPTWWVNWLKFDSTELFSTINVSVINEKHREALYWGIGLIIFGLIVLAYDTRRAGHTRYYIRGKSRDRILGLEQRYFLVVFNGLLLYLTLLFNSCGQ